MRSNWNHEDRHPAPRDIRRKENRKLRYEGRRIVRGTLTNGETIELVGTIQVDQRSLVSGR